MSYFNLNFSFPITFEKFSILDSSNKTAWQKIQTDFNINNHVIISDQQSAGKGRADRVWHSPLGNLYFSLIQKIQNKKLLELMPFVACVALNQTARFFLPNSEIQIKNKWPNDLMVNEKKISGILIESKTGKFGNFDCVIGVGVNLISSPINVIYPATNFAEFGIEVEKIKFLEKILENFFILIEEFQNFGFMPIRNLWLSEAFKLKKEINLNLFDKKLSGVFEDIDENGCLILRDEDSNYIKIDTAEIMPIINSP